MKWSIIVLVLLGVMAATAAGLLAASLSSRNGHTGIAGPARETQIVVAARPLETNYVLQADALTVRHMPASQVPKDSLRDPSLAIGKPLRMPVAEGQMLTANSFIPDESPRNMANRMLSPGQRAKTVSLPEDAALEGLLYPGCIVDVLWSYKADATKGCAMSRTLLENVSVLALNRQTILSDDVDAKAGNDSGRGSRNRQLVTLLLDSKQAATLQLAMDHGTISLALRNPTDEIQVTSPPVSLAGMIQGYAPMLAEWDTSAWAQGLRDLSQAIGKHLAQANQNKAQVEPAPTVAPVARREWETTVIRGPKVQVERFAEADARG
jgi:Flp pilus assembly protein CpaB